jgi:hypothetical protein
MDCWWLSEPSNKEFEGSMNTPSNEVKIGSPKGESASLQLLPQQQTMKPVIIQHEGTQAPISVSLNSPTDWPTVLATLTVGLGSILTSLVVGYLSHQNQKAQVRSSIASLRSAWIKELRQLAGEFIGLASRIGRALQSESSYLDSQAGRQEISQLFEVSSQIELMLDPKKPAAKSISSRMGSIVDSLHNGGFAKANELLNKFKEELSIILENGWSDVKEDLRNPGKSLKSP